MRKLTLILVVSVVVAALAGGQGPIRMPGMAKMQEYNSVQRPDVQKDLKLSDDQIEKVKTALREFQTQSAQVFQDSQGDPEAIQAGVKKLMDGLETAVKGALTPTQLTRLHEINIQMHGVAVVTDPDVQHALKLTDDQIKQIQDLDKTNREANTAAFGKAQSGEIERTQLTPLILKNAADLKAGLEKVLTDSQKADLKKMGGEPFTMDPNFKPQGPRGGRGN